ncbi:MAG: carboxypeptidase-like regulatory domain-containing protein [Fibrobacterales bacterium]
MRAYIHFNLLILILISIAGCSVSNESSGNSLSGIVVVGDNPVAAKVALYNAPLPDSLLYETVSDKNGQFTFTHIEEREYSVVVKKEWDYAEVIESYVFSQNSQHLTIPLSPLKAFRLTDEIGVKRMFWFSDELPQFLEDSLVYYLDDRSVYLTAVNEFTESTLIIVEEGDSVGVIKEYGNSEVSVVDSVITDGAIDTVTHQVDSLHLRASALVIEVEGNEDMRQWYSNGVRSLFQPDSQPIYSASYLDRTVFFTFPFNDQQGDFWLWEGDSLHKLSHPGLFKLTEPMFPDLDNIPATLTYKPSDSSNRIIQLWGDRLVISVYPAVGTSYVENVIYDIRQEKVIDTVPSLAGQLVTDQLIVTAELQQIVYMYGTDSLEVLNTEGEANNLQAYDDWFSFSSTQYVEGITEINVWTPQIGIRTLDTIPFDSIAGVGVIALHSHYMVWNTGLRSGTDTIRSFDGIDVKDIVVEPEGVSLIATDGERVLWVTDTQKLKIYTDDTVVVIDSITDGSIVDRIALMGDRIMYQMTNTLDVPIVIEQLIMGGSMASTRYNSALFPTRGTPQSFWSEIF